MTWLHRTTQGVLAEVERAKDAGCFPFFRPFENVGPHVGIGRERYVNFTSNDYLGLSQHADVKHAAIRGVEAYGTGLGSSRLQATSVRHEELEQRLARWLQVEACAIFPSGYQALVGTLQAFLDDETLVALDNQSHASVLDGLYLAKGQHPDLEERYFRHNSVKGLRRVLATTERANRLVVVEGLYGADGDLAPLDDMVKLCREFDAPLLVDDAHGIGAIGPGGRGAAEQYGVHGDVDLLVGTFSKVFGGVGGFLAGDADLVSFVKLTARSFVFSASLPVGQVESALAALDIVEQDDSRRQRLEANGDYFRAGLQSLDFSTGNSTTHICPIMIGDEHLAMQFGARLFDEANVIMLPFIYPGVPLGEARLRCNVTAAHERADLDHALQALARIGSELGIIGAKQGSA